MAAERYVYYKLRPERAVAARAAFEAARADAPVRLLQRQDSDPGMLTWMEIYGPELVDAAACERRIAAAMAPYVQGLRHGEAFDALR